MERSAHAQHGSSDHQSPLAPHILEIRRLKVQLQQVQGNIHSQTELIVSVRQHLLRRMVDYLTSVEPIYSQHAHNSDVMTMHEDLQRLLSDQNEAVLRMRQAGLKQLVDIKAHRAQLTAPPRPQPAGPL